MVNFFFLDSFSLQTISKKQLCNKKTYFKFKKNKEEAHQIIIIYIVSICLLYLIDSFFLLLNFEKISKM